MVKRRLKLAQIVCAVYALNKPHGVAKREILRFCKVRFGVSCSYKEFDHILERCLDEGVLTSFKNRYRVTKLNSGFIFKGGKDSIRKQSRLSKGKKRTRAAVKKNKKNSKNRSGGAGKIYLKISSSLYDLWRKKKLAEEVGLDSIGEPKTALVPMKKKSLCRKKSKTVRTQSKSRVKRLKTLRSNASKHKQRQKAVRGSSKNKRQSKVKVKATKIKRELKVGMKSRLRRTQKKEKSTKSANKDRKKGRKERKKENKERKKDNKERSGENSGNEKEPSENENENKGGESSTKSNNSNNSLAEGQKREFHRTLLRQTKQAVTHARSWDRLNYSRQRRQRENSELIKNSQLVQKILTQSHAASWDKLNDQLKQMKELASCSQPRDAKGDAWS